MTLKLTGCNCEDCQARKMQALILYGLAIEEAIFEVRRRMKASDYAGASAIVGAASAMARDHDLAGAVEALAVERAAEERAAGRLH